MSDDFPTFAEVGEENIRQRMLRLREEMQTRPHTIRVPKEVHSDE